LPLVLLPFKTTFTSFVSSKSLESSDNGESSSEYGLLLEEFFLLFFLISLFLTSGLAAGFFTETVLVASDNLLVVDLTSPSFFWATWRTEEGPSNKGYCATFTGASGIIITFLWS
jgi:hypothetical protein